MANFVRLPTYLIPETAIFLPFIQNHLLRFLISVLKNLKYLPAAFSGWLVRSKHHLIYFYFGYFLFSLLWLPNQFNGCLNYLSYLLVEVVLASQLTCVRWSSSDSLVENDNYYQFLPYLIKEDNHLFLPQRYGLNRYYSYHYPYQCFYFHLTSKMLRIKNRPRALVVKQDGDWQRLEKRLRALVAELDGDSQRLEKRRRALVAELDGDSQRLEKRRRISVAEVGDEPVSGYETPIIESDKPFVPNRELSNDTAQTEDLFGLPEYLFTEIVKKLHAFHDFAFCSTVCKLWRSPCSNLKWFLYPPHPWSIHFHGQNIMNHLDDGRYVLEQWEIDGRYYYGCVNGWILNIGSTNIHIVNHFSMTETSLPMLSPVGYLSITKPSDWYNYIQKFILFKACHGDNLQFLVVALFGRGGFIAFTGPQFQDWIYARSKDMARCRDVVRLGEQFYALCDRGNLFRCAFDRSNPRVLLVSKKLEGSSRDGRYYLLKNAGHPIAVFQKGEVGFGGKRFDTDTFIIYKYYRRGRNWIRRIEPTCLKDLALFISDGNSCTIDPAKVKGCRTNSIYFADGYWFLNNRGGHSTGVFDIANGTIEDFQFEMDQYPPNGVSPFSLTDNVGA